MTVFDLDKKTAIAFLPLPGGPDVIKFDPGLRRIYVACYSGAIAGFHQDDARRLSRPVRGAHGCCGLEDAQALHPGTGRGWETGSADGRVRSGQRLIAAVFNVQTEEANGT